jgi:hypothetical protein
MSFDQGGACLHQFRFEECQLQVESHEEELGREVPSAAGFKISCNQILFLAWQFVVPFPLIPLNQNFKLSCTPFIIRYVEIFDFLYFGKKHIVLIFLSYTGIVLFFLCSIGSMLHIVPDCSSKMKMTNSC